MNRREFFRAMPIVGVLAVIGATMKPAQWPKRVRDTGCGARWEIDEEGILSVDVDDGLTYAKVKCENIQTNYIQADHIDQISTATWYMHESAFRQLKAT